MLRQPRWLWPRVGLLGGSSQGELHQMLRHAAHCLLRLSGKMVEECYVLRYSQLSAHYACRCLRLPVEHQRLQLHAEILLMGLPA